LYHTWLLTKIVTLAQSKYIKIPKWRWHIRRSLPSWHLGASFSAKVLQDRLLFWTLGQSVEFGPVQATPLYTVVHP
jgi:hypothetical protein